MPESLIATVANLRKLEGRRQAIIARQKETGHPNHALLERLDIEREMRNAGPKLLAALDFQSGDADAISEIIALLEEIAEISKGDRELLHRYQAMAERMEGLSP